MISLVTVGLDTADEHRLLDQRCAFVTLVFSQTSSLQAAAEPLGCHLSMLHVLSCPSFVPASHDNKHRQLCHTLRHKQALLAIALIYTLILYLIYVAQYVEQDSLSNQRNMSRLRI